MKLLLRLPLAALGVLAVATPAGGCSLIKDFDGLGGAVPTTSSSAATTGAGGGGGMGTGGQGGDGGSGASLNCVPPANQVYKGLVLNEINPQGSPSDWLELKNTTLASIDLCGVMIVQDYIGGDPLQPGLDRHIFAESVLIAPDNYYVLVGAFNISSEKPDRFTMFTPAPVESVIDNTAWVVDGSTSFHTNDTWGRIPDGCGDFAKILDNATFNGENGDPNGAGGAPSCPGPGVGGGVQTSTSGSGGMGGGGGG